MIQQTQQLMKPLSFQTKGMTMMVMTPGLTLIGILQQIQKIQTEHTLLNQGPLPPQPVVSQYL